jgi:protein tyrosine phosphatase
MRRVAGNVDSGGGGGIPDVAAQALAIISQRLQDSRQLMWEFDAVMHLDQKINSSMHDAQAPGAVQRNRYTNVLPYDYNRVRLPPPAASPGAVVGSGGGLGGTTAAAAVGALLRGGVKSAAATYINASSITMLDRYAGREFAYIATQVCVCV